MAALPLLGLGPILPGACSRFYCVCSDRTQVPFAAQCKAHRPAVSVGMAHRLPTSGYQFRSWDQIAVTHWIVNARMLRSQALISR